MLKKLMIMLAAVMVALFMLSSQAFASITFTDPIYNSTVIFEQSGGTLTVTLTSGRDATGGGSELTAVFFNLDGFSGTLIPATATLPTGTKLWANGTNVPYTTYIPDGLNVGGEWEYLAAVTIGSATRSGISSAGLDLFGDANFPGPNLTNENALDGGDWGLTSGTTAGSGRNQPFVQNTTVFTLTGADSFVPSASNVKDVSFYYGTVTATDFGTPVPIPAAAWLLGSGLIGLVAMRRRFRK